MATTTASHRKQQGGPVARKATGKAVNHDIHRAAERPGSVADEHVTFRREDLDLIAETLDEAILSGVAAWAAVGSTASTASEDVTHIILKTGQARLLIQDEIERAEQAAGGAS